MPMPLILLFAFTPATDAAMPPMPSRHYADAYDADAYAAAMIFFAMRYA